MLKTVIYQAIIHSFENARKTCASKRHLLLQNNVSHCVRRCNVVFTLERRNLYMSIYDTIQLLAGFPQCNGGKFEEAEDFKYVLVVYCVLKSK